MSNTSIWKQKISAEILQKRNQGSLSDLFQVRFTNVDEEAAYAEMPMRKELLQPNGIMHGGVSCVLAETLASAAACYTVEEGRICVGIDLNTNHLRPVKEGLLLVKAFPYHMGKTTQVWGIEICDEQKRLVSISRLTLAVRQI